MSEAVASGEAEFGICSMPALDPGLSFERLIEDQRVLVLPAGHARAGAEAVTWDRLAREDLILSARNTGNRVLIDDAIARAGDALRWTYETERSTTALALVAGGAGVAVLPRSLVQTVSDPRITWRPITQPQIARPVGFLDRIGRTESSEVAGLKHEIRAACQAVYPNA